MPFGTVQVDTLTTDNRSLSVDNISAITGATFTGDVSTTEALSVERVKEKVRVITGTPPSQLDIDVKFSSVVFYTDDAGANSTVNIRGDANTTLDSLMDVGQSLTIAVVLTYGATAYYTSALQIDGLTNNRTVKYVGGAPAGAASVNSLCASTYTVIKTNSNTFTVLVSKSEFVS